VSALAPWLAIVAALAAAVVQLRSQGRLWSCACGYVLVWAGNVRGADNSQHLLDPYSVTHVLHGFVLAGLLAWSLPRLPAAWQLALAVALEALWEVLENSPFVIARYRATAALGYEGDAIVNSLGDIAACGLGVGLARALGFRRAVATFALAELALLVWIRDGLLLNVLMLIAPIPAIKAWQAGP
jgi:hypothetical protein